MLKNAYNPIMQEITLRDHIATAVASKLLECAHFGKIDEHIDKVPEKAYLLADKMLEYRKLNPAKY